MGNFAQMSGDRFAAGGTGSVARLFANPAPGFVEAIAGEWHFFDPTMNTGLLKRLERRGLRLGETRFDSALRENPPPAAALHQQELQPFNSNAITNGGNLLAFIPPPKSGR